MSDYSHGKIYKVTCESGLVYIGSTVRTLKKRFTQHTKPTNDCETRHFINPKIELIENFPCETKQELLWREREWFDKTDCVNKMRPIRSDEEYIEQYLAEGRKYREKNREKLIEKFNCDCGGRFTHHNKAQHKKTKLHQNYVAGLTTNL